MLPFSLVRLGQHSKCSSKRKRIEMEHWMKKKRKKSREKKKRKKSQLTDQLAPSFVAF